MYSNEQQARRDCMHIATAIREGKSGVCSSKAF